jgi:hypothetical protein
MDSTTTDIQHGVSPRNSLNWSEPAYSNNKLNDSFCGLKRVCSARCQICPMLDTESFVIKSNINGRKYPVLTNEDLS